MSRHAAPSVPDLGVLEWFEVGEHERVERVLGGLRELGIERLRTGLSWAGWHTPGGPEWYDWLFARLAAEVEVLPSVTFTPPSLGVVPRTSAPPRRPRDYADFIDVALTRYGRHFERIELWNEPNSRAEWDWTLDVEWKAFGQMVGDAAYWVKQRGWSTVLGGMSPIDASWLGLMGEYGVLAYIDVVGVHGFPGTWEANWDGWEAAVGRVREVLEYYAPDAEVWITEAGFSTWRDDHLGQLRAFVDALAAPVPRVYWYAAEDLTPERSALGSFHEDEREYHFGLRHCDGRPKLLARLVAAGGPAAVEDTVRLAERPRSRAAEPVAVITGGAGFVGTNVAGRLAEEGRRVRLLDALARPGSERNLRWLCETYGDRIEAELGDVRDRFAVRRALEGASEVFHLAAQVAVTTSLDDPIHDFDVNLRGTLNVLEELRRLPKPVPLVFTSTNKVYGALPDIRLVRTVDSWQPVDDRLREHGVPETRHLDFCTPYGCSKGGADQYVLDYAKTHGLPALVFRMSCIYGPHQHGNEDQGWVAHFLLRALADEPITIYGDGAQVRDILYVDDLVEALLLARDSADTLAGTAFNIGGGPDNAVSLLEVVDLIDDALGERPELLFSAERPGDQRYYVSDTSRFHAAVGWQPLVGAEEGIRELVSWLDGGAVRSRGGARAAAR